MEIKGLAEHILVPNGCYQLTPHVLKLYDNFNQEVFDKQVETLPYLKDFVDAVYDIHKQIRPKYTLVDDWTMNITEPTIKNEKDILLAFSGGLDSCYMAILLKELGLNAHLVHIRNINGYEGAMSYVVSKLFADELGFNYIECTFKRKGGKENKYHQFWEDNTAKNQLIATIMIDIALSRGISKIALGDDRSMSAQRPDMTLGINSTDCREVQESFEACIKNIAPGIDFVLIDRDINSTNANKYDRLIKLANNKALDFYYSCVGAGRFNQYNHRMNEAKFSVTLPKYNCGCSCAKCALHNLLLFYGGHADYPILFIDKCWERLWNTSHGTIEALFAPHIPLQQRINNLFTY